jgi:hypothetical protein
MRTISLKKAIKFIASLALLIPGALEATISVSKRNFNIDISETAPYGTILYRPDGTDSTLLCFSRFKSFSEPVAFRVYDHEGEDAYPENFSQIMGVGKQLNIPECRVNHDGNFSRDKVVQCLGKLAKKAVTVGNGRLFAEKVDYSKECGDQAQPKNVKIVSSKGHGCHAG